LTRGRAATPDPFDLRAVSRSDELFEALSSRRPADLSAARADPAVGLLAALAADVDAGAPPLPTPARVPCGMPASRRRGVRAFVTFGVAAVVLASAGAAAAGAGGESSGGTTSGSLRLHTSERSNKGLKGQDPALARPAGHRSPQDPRFGPGMRSAALPPAKHGTRGPGSAKQRPENAKRPPGDAKQPPGDTEQPPGSAEQSPGSADGPPGSMEHGPGNPGRGPGDGGHGSGDAGHGPRHAGHGSGDGAAGQPVQKPAPADPGPHPGVSGVHRRGRGHTGPAGPESARLDPVAATAAARRT
jgi:hypothetical protein